MIQEEHKAASAAGRAGSPTGKRAAPMYVDWEYYKIFYYVAKYQNFTRAARVLGNNQPNITHAMNRLESQLNCVLFIRSNRGVTLTPEGELLYSRIASAAVQIQDAEEELSATATLEHGAISISTTETALNIYLSEKLRAFHTEYPGIRLRISNHSTPQAVQAVRNGEVDFAIVTTPAEVENGLKMVELMPFYEVLVGGKTFTALASQTLSLKELAGYPLICLNEESMTRSFYRQFFLEHDAVLKPDTEAATTDQMLTLVKSELGLAFMPEPMAAPLLASGELVQLHLQEIIPSRSICLVYDHHRPLNTAARKFQQLLTKAGTRSAERK
ncbi:LysR substrate binding domain protein [Faecalibacterium prausnitzii M21/2]|nr:LysR substrate binding domain protein [Faecalibacterium prausnitzii M21/2]